MIRTAYSRPEWFSRHNDSVLDEVQTAVAGRPADSAFILLLDFDGTLAEFNPDPAAPQLTPERRDLTRAASPGNRAWRSALSAAAGSTTCAAAPACPTASITPACTDWKSRSTAAASIIPIFIAPPIASKGWPTTLSRLVSEFPGAVIEDKVASVAVHVRGVAPERREAVLARADILAVPWIAEGRVRRLEGDAVVEYLPNINGHKGDATRWIAADVEARLGRPAWVAYVGDDITDEDAFRAITGGHQRAGWTATHLGHAQAQRYCRCRSVLEMVGDQRVRSGKCVCRFTAPSP